MNIFFIRRKAMKRIYRRMHEMNAFWKRNAWKVKPYVNEDLASSLHSAFGHIEFTATFSEAVAGNRQWNCSYPQIFIDFINFLHDDDLNFSPYSYPFYPDEYVMDLMDNACFLIARAMKISRVEGIMERLRSLAIEISYDICMIRGIKGSASGVKR